MTDEAIPMRLRCEVCHALHIDVGEFATKAHHTHACQNCGAVWRPAIVPTVGVEFLPGFKNGERAPGPKIYPCEHLSNYLTCDICNQPGN